MSATITQCEAILAILRLRPQGLTARDAMRELECYRLAARIADLRAGGWNVVTHSETRNGRTYARYQLAPPPVPETEQRALWVSWTSNGRFRRRSARELGVGE